MALPRCPCDVPSSRLFQAQHRDKTPITFLAAGAHRDIVRGVRWLGSSARLVTFSSEKAGPAGHRNTLLLTDVRARVSTPFREVKPEP